MKSKKKKKNSFPIVQIEWWDHTGDAAWYDKQAIQEVTAVKCCTIGYLVEENTTTFKVVDTITDDNGYGGLSVILKSCVIDFWELQF